MSSAYNLFILSAAILIEWLIYCISTIFLLVLELAEGGELFDKIIEKTKFNEAEAKLHFFQIASAIQYLHHKVRNPVPAS